MYPVLVTMYVKLARREEREVAATFGAAYQQWAAGTPGFFPSLSVLLRVGRPETGH